MSHDLQSYETFPHEHREAMCEELARKISLVTTEDVARFLVTRECGEGRDPEHLLREFTEWLEEDPFEHDRREIAASQFSGSTTR